MKNIFSYLLPLVLAISAPAWGAIYRTIDANGNVTYTDQPPANSNVQAEQIEIAPPNTFADNTPRALWEPDSLAGFGDDAAAAKDYSLAITTPRNDANVRENAGNIVVSTQISPELRDGDVARLKVDGALTAQPGKNGSFFLTNLSRGTHQVGLIVEDAEGRQLSESPQIEFHLQRTSLFQPFRVQRNDTNTPRP